jgi:hypothetical protein
MVLKIMAWNPHPKVADAREFGRKWNKQMVVVLSMNTKENTLELTSYGDTVERCKAAKVLGDAAYDAVMEYASRQGAGPRNPLREALEIMLNYPGVDSYVTAVCLDALQNNRLCKPDNT